MILQVFRTWTIINLMMRISMKKIMCALVLFGSIFFFSFGQESIAPENPIDLVLVLDTSSGMSDSYRELQDYLTGPFLSEFLRIGDTFHLISFSDGARIEIARRIEGIGDVRTIIGRIFLMYPLDPNSDISAAIKYTENYISFLPGTRQKKVVFFSKGDSFSGSSGQTANGVESLIAETAPRFSRLGAELRYIPVPFNTGPSSGRAPAAITQAPARQAVPGGASAPPASASGTVPSPTVPASRENTQTPGSASSREPASPAPPAAVTPPPASAAVPPVSATPAPAGSTAPQSAASSAPPASSRSRPADSTAPSSAAAPPPVSAAVPPPATARPELPSAVPAPSVDVSPVPLQARKGSEAPVVPAEGTSSEIVPPTAERQEPENGAGSPGEVPASSSSVPAVPDRGFATPLAGLPPVGGSPPARGGIAESPASIGNLPIPLLIGFAVLAILLLGLIIFFASGRLRRSPNRAMAHAALPRRKEQEKPRIPAEDKNAELFANYAATQRRRTTVTPQDISRGNASLEKTSIEQSQTESYSGPLMLSLFVEDQNTFIGRRNIHTVKPGYTFTIGGGKSDFLIFLVPMPPRIAEIRFDGRQCAFFPRKPQFFPDIGSKSISNCIGKTIRIISEKNYELHIRMERYEDPLVALNRLLHSVNVPG
jgi:hypothetical protein